MITLESIKFSFLTFNIPLYIYLDKIYFEIDNTINYNDFWLIYLIYSTYKDVLNFEEPGCFLC